MRVSVDLLDHGSEPGRYTLIDGSGRVITANENGTIVFQRRCHNPYSLVYELSREPGVRIVKPGQQAEIVDRIYRQAGITRNEPKPIKTMRPTPVMLPDDARVKLLIYARSKWPTGDSYYARLSRQGNYVVGFTNDYPLQHGIGEEETLTPEQFQRL